MSLSLEPDVYEEPVEWTGPFTWHDRSYYDTNYRVVKIKVIININSVKDNKTIMFNGIDIPIKLLIIFIKKSKHGTVSFNEEYYTIIFSTKLFGCDYFLDFYYRLADCDCMIFVKAIENIGLQKNNNIIQAIYSSNVSGKTERCFCYESIGIFFFADENDLHENLTCLVDGEERNLYKIDNNIYYLKLRYSFDELVDFYNCIKKPHDKYFLYVIGNLNGKFKEALHFLQY